MSSIIKVNKIQNRFNADFFSNNLFSLKYDNILQIKTGIIHDRAVYTTPVRPGSAITPFDVTITPRSRNSIMVWKIMINGETHHNTVFTIYKNGTFAPDGINNTSTNRWVGFAPHHYDNNQSSTPSNNFILYIDKSNETIKREKALYPIDYQLRVQSSNDSTQTSYYLNRTVASAGADAYENMVSTYVLTEYEV